MDPEQKFALYLIALGLFTAASIFLSLSYWVLSLVFWGSGDFYWSCTSYSFVCLIAPVLAWFTLSMWHRENEGGNQ